MSLVLENASFSQELNDTFQQPTEDLSFEARKKTRRRRLTRVSSRRPVGKTVYGKSGKRLIGKYVRK